jgi:hypothetical protein
MLGEVEAPSCCDSLQITTELKGTRAIILRHLQLLFPERKLECDVRARTRVVCQILLPVHLITVRHEMKYAEYL